MHCCISLLVFEFVFPYMDLHHHHLNSRRLTWSWLKKFYSESILNTRYTPEKNANWFFIFIEVVILAIAS